MQRRLVAVMAVDMVGYSRLLAADEADTIQRQKAHRVNLIDPRISHFDGRITKTAGDGLLVEFPSIIDAVQCAVEIQHAILEREAAVPEERRMLYRIGITVGDIVFDSDDIQGDVVNIAARLEGLAEPGGVCVSDVVYRNLQGKLDILFEDRGEQALKNLARKVRVWAWVSDSAIDDQQPVRGSATLPLPDQPSIAVLPFTNMSEDTDQEYFSDGITEEIITELSRFRSLFVISPNSSFAFKGQAINLSQVTKRLGVRYILQGSVRKAGGRVRITARLIDGGTNGHLWAERYDGLLDDIFSLQDEITERVVWALVGHLEHRETRKARNRGSALTTEYDLRLRAEDHMGRYTPSDTAEAIRLLEKAVAMGADSGRTLSSLAAAYQQQHRWTGDINWIRRSERIARAASASSDPEDWTDASLAYCAAMLGDYSRAERLMQKAVAYNPHNRHTILYNAVLQNMRGKPEGALQALARLRRLDPINPAYVDEEEGYAFYLSHRYEESVAAFERSMPNGSYQAHACLAAAYGQTGNTTAARCAWESSVNLRPGLTLELFVEDSQHENQENVEHWVEGLSKASLPE